MPRSATAIVLIVATLLMQGCISMRHYHLGEPLTEADSPAVDDDLSMHDVMASLGPPQRLSATPNEIGRASCRERV